MGCSSCKGFPLCLTVCCGRSKLLNKELPFLCVCKDCDHTNNLESVSCESCKAKREYQPDQVIIDFDEKDEILRSAFCMCRMSCLKCAKRQGHDKCEMENGRETKFVCKKCCHSKYRILCDVDKTNEYLDEKYHENENGFIFCGLCDELYCNECKGEHERNHRRSRNSFSKNLEFGRFHYNHRNYEIACHYFLKSLKLVSKISEEEHDYSPNQKYYYNRLNVLTLIAETYGRTKEFSRSMKYFEMVIKILKSGEEKYTEWFFMCNMKRYLEICTRFSKKYKKGAKIGLELMKKLKKKKEGLEVLEEKLFVLKCLTLCLSNIEELNSALKYSRERLRITREIRHYYKSEDGLHYSIEKEIIALHEMAILCFRFSRYSKCVELSEKVLKMMEENRTWMIDEAKDEKKREFIEFREGVEEILTMTQRVLKEHDEVTREEFRKKFSNNPKFHFSTLAKYEFITEHEKERERRSNQNRGFLRFNRSTLSDLMKGSKELRKRGKEKEAEEEGTEKEGIEN